MVTLLKTDLLNQDEVRTLVEKYLIRFDPSHVHLARQGFDKMLGRLTTDSVANPLPASVYIKTEHPTKAALAQAAAESIKTWDKRTRAARILYVQVYHHAYGYSVMTGTTLADASKVLSELLEQPTKKKTAVSV